MTPCALTTSGASTSSGIAGRALGPRMALRVRAHRLMDSSVRTPTAPTVLFRLSETSVATGHSPNRQLQRPAGDLPAEVGSGSGQVGDAAVSGCDRWSVRLAARSVHRWYTVVASSHRAARALHGERCPADRWRTKPDTEHQVLGG